MNEELQELNNQIQTLRLRKSGLQAIMEGLTTTMANPKPKTEQDLENILADLERLFQKIEQGNAEIQLVETKIAEFREKYLGD